MIALCFMFSNWWSRERRSDRREWRRRELETWRSFSGEEPHVPDYILTSKLSVLTDYILYTLYCEVSWVWVLARVQDDIICIALKMTSSCALGTSGYNVMWCVRLVRWASASHVVLLCMLLDLCCRKQEEYQQCQPHEQEAAALFEEVGI